MTESSPSSGRANPSWTLCAVALLAGCRATGPLGPDASPALPSGEWAVHARAGVFDDFEAESRIEIESVNFGSATSEFTADLVGELGLQLGVEHGLGRGLSLLGGVDVRRFEPDPIPGFVFREIDYGELFLGVRWVTPWRLDDAGRLAPFVEAKVGWTPGIAFDGELDLSSQGATIPNPEFEFEGTALFNVGASVGLAYRWSRSLVVHASLLYETPLGASEDDVVVDLGLGPAVPPLELATELEPEGLVGWLGVGWRH